MLIATVLALVIGTVYWPVYQFEFVNFDDEAYVSDNPHVASGLTIDAVRYAFLSTDVSNWHPLTWLSLQLDSSLYGRWAGGYHITNVLLHLVGTLALYGALAQMTGSPWASGGVALLYAIHPLHVESVAWVSERKGILSTCLWMLAWLAYAWYVRQPSWQRMSLVTFLLGLGLLAKQMLVTFPFAMLLLDHWPLRRPPRINLLKEKCPLLAIILLFLPIAYLAQSQGGSVRQSPWDDRLIAVPIAYSRYLQDLCWPVSLHLPYVDNQHLTVTEAGNSIVLLVTLALLALWQRRQRPYLLMGYFWFVLVMAPVCGIVPVGVQWRADRYTDIPSVGIFIAVVWGMKELIARFPDWRVGMIGVVAAALLLLGVTTTRQLRMWHDSLSLWTHVVSVAPDNRIAIVNLSAALLEAGRGTEALPLLVKAKELDLETKYRVMTHYNLGILHFQERRFAEAIAEYERGLALRPDDAKLHNNLGNTLYVVGQDARAREHLNAAVNLQPAYGMAHYNLANVLTAMNEPAEARRHYQKAIELLPAGSPVIPKVKQKLAAYGS